MSFALIVLNPRRIPECVEAFERSAGNVGIPVCWLSNMDETRAADEINRAVNTTRFDHYIVCSDDVRIGQTPLWLVCRQALKGHPVVTGYCNLDEADNARIVNLATNRLLPPPPAATYYTFLTLGQVNAHRFGTTFPTTFAGLALTCLERRVLLDHPMEVSSNGGQMDYVLSYNLQQAGVPLVAAAGAYVHHVKERWNHMDRNPAKRLLVGVEPERVRWESFHRGGVTMDAAV